MTNTIDYSGMIDRAMRSVVKECLIFAQKNGLPGQHHFFISFRTDHPGTKVSETLRAKYPEEMTIVMQHQFWDLKIEDDLFCVMLSFSNVPEKLVVPYAALTAFADPSIKFGLQFHAELAAREQQNNPPKVSAQAESEAESEGDAESQIDKVISIDSFRKK